MAVTGSPYGAGVPGDRLMALVFPARCPGCGRPAEPVCAGCLGSVGPALVAPPPAGIDRWAAPFAYDGVMRELVARAKYRNRHAALCWLADRMADAWERAGWSTPDLVTWVPAAPRRRRARGIDHARLLGRRVARHLGAPASDLLVRRDRGAQTDRDLATRRRGPTVAARGPVAGHVLVVDDVATTGATLRVCAAVLRHAGASAVDALTGARTPPHRRMT